MDREATGILPPKVDVTSSVHELFYFWHSLALNLVQEAEEDIDVQTTTTLRNVIYQFLPLPAQNVNM